MLFSVDYDIDDCVRFYVVPDTGGSVPSVRILDGNVELLTLAANENRPELVGAGRHATGMCGFLIDNDVLPDLASRAALDIRDADSGLIIYRRPQPTFIQDTKVFRLETHLLPLWRIDDAFKEQFQYWYKSIDRRGYETSNQVFCIIDCSSAFVSGRLFFKNIEYYLNIGFKAVVIFRDPYEELAERLIILKNVTDKTVELLGPRDMLTFEPVIEYLTALDQFDEDSCKRFFKRAPDFVLAPLSNPFVRQLTASTPDEMLKKTSIAQALAALSTFEIVGLRSEAADFSHALGDMLALEPKTVPVMGEYARVKELGQRLRSIREVEAILEYDINIYEQTRHAFGAVAAGKIVADDPAPED